jgi:hypothetical protein
MERDGPAFWVAWERFVKPTWFTDWNKGNAPE